MTGGWPLSIALWCGVTSCAFKHDVLGISAGDIVYSSPDKTFVVAAINSQFYVGPFVQSESYASIPLIMGSDGPAEDKSTGAIRCISGGATMTFAVPREIQVGQSFDCDAHEFRVESCEPEEACTRYLVSAVCPRYVQGRCVQSAHGPEPGAFRYNYVWSAQQGITYIDFAPDSDEGDVSLRTRSGFLGPGGP
jgi:hypothetical protein